MEKQRMAFREQPARFGLLILLWVFLLFFAPFFFIYAQEPMDVLVVSTIAEERVEEIIEERLVVDIMSTPASPIVGGTWTVTVLVDHPISREVEVQPPRFPANIILERVRTDVRNVRPPEGSEDEIRRWTAVEYLFSLRQGGNTNLSSFQVTVGSLQASTSAISVQIRNIPPPPAPNPPVFRWENLPASLTLSKAVDLNLILTNWDPSKPIPRNLFQGMVPEMVIMDELLFSLTEGGVIRYPIRVIPLQGDNIIFGPLTVQIEGDTFQIPRFSLPVIQADSVIPVSAEINENDAVDIDYTTLEVTNPDIFSIPFPSGQEKIFFIFQSEYDRIVIIARDLWNQGRRSEALAFIRKNERDSFSGPFFAPLRREMEKNLGIAYTMDEDWGFLNHRFFLLIFAILFCLSAGLVIKKQANFSFIKVLKNISSPVFIIGVFGVFFIFIGIGIFIGSFRTIQISSAVLDKTEAYRVPDITGNIQAGFDEGQPVSILSSSGQWIYAESIDGRAGWVPINKVYPY